MLSFRVTDSGKSIEIDCDADGMSKLLGTLATLVGERASHIHLRAPSCGGLDLSDITPNGEVSVGDVVISYAESGLD